MDNHAVADLDARGWAGQTALQVQEWLQDLPLVEGIPKVVEWCRDHQIAAYLATLAWSPVGDYLCERFGFAASCGPTLATTNGQYTGEVARSFDEFDKRDFAKTVAIESGFSLRECAAIGDSRSDLPLFREVGFGVAFNASAALRDSADFICEGNDLSLAIPALEGWLISPR